MLKRVLLKLYHSSPKEVLQYTTRKLGFSKTSSFDPRKAESIKLELEKVFARYKVEQLNGISTEEFSQYLHQLIGSVDYQSEGYKEEELESQRDLSIKFHWGHDHDFGDFQFSGRMGSRHLGLLANFLTLFPVSLENFKDKDIFDVGCWTGGTALLLAALGNRVFAIEEVKKYAEVVSFLAKSFGIQEQLSANPLSIYGCNSNEFHNRFDIVHFPGVIYHLSDPLISLRILFNSLRDGGFILIESAGINHDEPYCRFDGSLIHLSGEKKKMNRGGWNWFMPSPSSLERMMLEAGFEEVQSLWHNETGRVYAYGKKSSQKSICRAGLSVPDIL